MIDKIYFKLAIARAAVVLIPSYTIAFLTDKMVYVVPTLAAASFFAATLKFQEDQNARRVDEDGESSDNDAESNGSVNPADLGV